MAGETKTMDLGDLLQRVQALYVLHGEIPVTIRSESRRQSAGLLDVLAEKDASGETGIHLVFEALDQGAVHG